MYCNKCGKEIDDQAVVCPGCGVATANYQAQQAAPAAVAAPAPIIINNTNTNTNTVGGFQYVQKSKLTTLLLCLFLGGLGIHRFYVGKTGTGLIWFFTAGLFGIGWFIDFIMILIGAFKDKAGQPLK
ncbi:MAG: NINE protein [Oscillospiraceae bacterium]